MIENLEEGVLNGTIVNEEIEPIKRGRGKPKEINPIATKDKKDKKQITTPWRCKEMTHI